ncbi:MAG: hypothetical protein K2M29_03965 [Paramuribaculum sp.]|nr:hypothetical protein [Paramuribaculum sp.]
MHPPQDIPPPGRSWGASPRAQYTTAERYLGRAGNSPEAIYARGALAFLQGDYDTAERLMRQASSIEASQSTLDEIDRIRNHNSNHITSKYFE